MIADFELIGLAGCGSLIPFLWFAGKFKTPAAGNKHFVLRNISKHAFPSGEDSSLLSDRRDAEVEHQDQILKGVNTGKTSGQTEEKVLRGPKGKNKRLKCSNCFQNGLDWFQPVPWLQTSLNWLHCGIKTDESHHDWILSFPF